MKANGNDLQDALTHFYENRPKKQEYYAGGEKSGIALEAPNTSDDLIKQIVEQAKQGGETINDTQQRAFRGAGHRLNSSNIPTEEAEELQTVTRQLTFWSKGWCLSYSRFQR